MTTEARTKIAAEILACKPAEVKAKVKAMPPTERATLTDQIDTKVWTNDWDRAVAEGAGGWRPLE